MTNPSNATPRNTGHIKASTTPGAHHESFELRNDLPGATEVEPRRELVLDKAEARLLKTNSVLDDLFAVTGENVAVDIASALAVNARVQGDGEF